MPIHIMFQPDHLSAREMALEDVDVYVEEPAFLRALCAETRSVPRSAPMSVRRSLPLLPAPCRVATSLPRRLIRTTLPCRLALPTLLCCWIFLPCC